jgi:HEAT repeat protein
LVAAVVALSAGAAALRAEDIAPPENVAKPLADLKSPDESVRLKAARELAKLGAAAKPALDALNAAAEKDSDEVVRIVAKYAADRIRSGETEQTVKDLIAGLKDKDFGVRFAAAKQLASMGPTAKAALPTLSEVAEKDPEPTIRKVAAAARDAITPPAVRNNEAVAPLIKLLSDKDIGKRFKAAKELGAMGAAAAPALPALQEATKDADADVAATAKNALEQVQAGVRDAAVQEQIALLKDKDVATRLAAAKDLQIMGPPAKAAVPALTDALKDSDEDVRAVAEKALGAIRSAPVMISGNKPRKADAVHDEAKLLKPATVDAANEKIGEIKFYTRRNVAVETRAELPAGQEIKGFAEGLLAEKKLDGILIVIVRKPGKLQVVLSKDALKDFPAETRDELVKVMLEPFRKGDFDAGVLEGLKFIYNKLPQVKP